MHQAKETFIEFVKIEDELQRRGLGLIELHALNGDREPYRALLLQPDGMVEATATRIGHADRVRGEALCRNFLAEAVSSVVDLAVTPEYCVPWTLIEEIARETYSPSEGGIWALGCESMTPASLLEAVQRWTEAGLFAHVERIDERRAAHHTYADPLVYVFWARSNTRPADNTLCMVIQLKTCPCRDALDVEQTALYRGIHIYTFNREINCTALLTIICSDAFDFTDHVSEYHSNALILHIQLNPKPAHVDYAAYRTRLCSVGANSSVELLCLNWAAGVTAPVVGANRPLILSTGVSAWYTSANAFKAEDVVIEALHRNGLYYNILRERWHAFILQFKGQLILLSKQPLRFFGEQALAPSTFGSVIDRWDIDNAGALGSNMTPNDGLNHALVPYDRVAAPLAQIATESPLAVERVLELLMGQTGKPSTWYEASELTTVHLDSHEESIRRVTVCQEEGLHRAGTVFRSRLLQRANDVTAIHPPWPAPMKDMSQGFRFRWHRSAPHFNVEPIHGGLGPAALIYLSDQNDLDIVSTIYEKCRKSLVDHVNNQKTGPTQAELTSEIIRSLDRLCVIFRKDDVLHTYDPNNKQFTEAPPRSPAEFTEAPK